VLNLGLNDEIVAGMVNATGNKKWAYDCYRRLIQMFNNVVLGSSNEPFEEVIKRIKKNRVRTWWVCR
jgi:pyruvate, orthophosphate dikinase